MEKILPHPIVPRFFDSPRDEKQHTDRMMVRGVQVVRDEDPGDRPKWRGDHSFSADAAKYSFTNFIEPEVAKSHPGWTREQVREQSLEKFEKRLRQDQSFEQKESAHEESSINWQPVQTENGWELATAYGDTMITLSELWEHTREFAAFAGNPAAYNAQEHATQLRMQDAFIRGEATGFVSVLSHPDAIRYVQLWNKADDGSIVSTHIDLSKTTGRDFTYEEGATLIHHLQSVHGDVDAPESSYAHFFVRGESVSEYDIRAIAVAHTIVMNHTSVPRDRRSLGDTVLRDTTDSVIVLGAYLRNHIEQKISDFKEHTQKIRKPLGEHLISVIEKKKGATSRRTNIDTQEPIKSVLADWFMTKRMLENVDRVPIAAVAAMAWITRDIAIPVTKLDVAKRVGTTRYAESEKKTTEIKKSAKKNFFNRVGELIAEATKKFIAYVTFEQTLASSQTRNKSIESTLLHIVAVQGYLKRFTSRVKFVLGIITDRGTKTWGRRFVDTTIHWLRAILRHTKPSEAAKIHEEAKMREYVPRKVTLLRFAFLMWWIIRGLKLNERPPVETEHIFRHESVSVPGFRRRRLKAGTETTPSQWVLLSIIWYLSMLREVGFAKKKQKKKSTRSLLWHHISLRFVIE